MLLGGARLGNETDTRTRRWHIEGLRRFGDEPTEQVLARRFEREPRSPAAAITDDEHRWMERVVTAVRSVHANFLVVADAPRQGLHSDRIQLLDDRASVSLEVRPDWVGITPLTDYSGDPAAGFALMWQICKAVARDANCLIIDPTAIVVIEMQLDVERAREEYGWI